MIRQLLLATAFAMVFAVAAPSSGPARAQPAPAAPISAEDQALVDRAVAYLEGLDQMQGRFAQIDSKGQASAGAFYLDRPNRARLEYESPSSLLIVCDGSQVLVHDKRLNTFENYPLDATPLSLFLAAKVRFEPGMVEAVERQPGGFAITIRDDRHTPQGRITLTFADAPMTLKQWSIVDSKDQRTTVSLTELKPASGLDPGLFVLRDTRLPPPIR
jgi:outer membrane lipoprotein-sorting protein